MATLVRAASIALVSLFAARASAQDFGHKVLGTVGLKGASQPATGLYLGNRIALYEAHALFDRQGNPIPLDFSSQALSNALAVSGTYEIRPLKTFVSASVAIPIARVVARSDEVRGSLDRFGLADAYFQPLRLGWRLPHLDLVTGYAFYVPTRRFSPGGQGGVSRASWSHEVSFGGTLYFDRARTWHLSVLTSIEINHRKLGIDVTRGTTLQMQGGAGKTFFRILDAGVVGYALWQVTDDSGSQLPPVLRGARDRAFGAGAEIGARIPSARARVVVRYAHDFAVESRPEGQIILVGVYFAPLQDR